MTHRIAPLLAALPTPRSGVRELSCFCRDGWLSTSYTSERVTGAMASPDARIAPHAGVATAPSQRPSARTVKSEVTGWPVNPAARVWRDAAQSGFRSPLLPSPCANSEGENAQ